MTVTWKLREDVFWADGEQVTADDVIFTWDAGRCRSMDTRRWITQNPLKRSMISQSWLLL